MACTTFSQENFRPVIITNDSVAFLCFDSANAGKLAVRIIELQEQKQINLVHTEKIGSLEASIANEKHISDNLSHQNQKYKDMVEEYKGQLVLDCNEIEKLQKEVRRQKFQKYLLITGVVIVAALGVFY